MSHTVVVYTFGVYALLSSISARDGKGATTPLPSRLSRKREVVMRFFSDHWNTLEPLGAQTADLKQSAWAYPRPATIATVAATFDGGAIRSVIAQYIAVAVVWGSGSVIIGLI